MLTIKNGCVVSFAVIVAYTAWYLQEMCLPDYSPSRAQRNFASPPAGALVIEASPTWTDPYPASYFLFIRLRSAAPDPITALTVFIAIA